MGPKWVAFPGSGQDGAGWPRSQPSAARSRLELGLWHKPPEDSGHFTFCLELGSHCPPPLPSLPRPGSLVATPGPVARQQCPLHPAGAWGVRLSSPGVARDQGGPGRGLPGTWSLLGGCPGIWVLLSQMALRDHSHRDSHAGMGLGVEVSQLCPACPHPACPLTWAARAPPEASSLGRGQVPVKAVT